MSKKEQKNFNVSTGESVSADVEEEGWWTNNFLEGKVLPWYFRALLSPVYAIYTLYLCLRGIPINIQIRRKKKPIKITIG